MLEDIKKILEISKKGLVIMENGKPAYVVVPFEDYIDGDFADTKAEDAKNKDDASKKIYLGDDMLDVQRMIESEVEQKRNELADEKALEIKDIVRNNTPKDARGDLREIRLEDLPF